MSRSCIAGFDYGTSHCSIGLWRDGRVELVPLEDESTLVASTLYAPKTDFELELGEHAVLDMTSRSFTDLLFGQSALDAYLQDPTQGYFVKSPKSFLGAPGLPERVKDRFIAVVAAMMANVKRAADLAARAPVRQVVIGRPVNFQGPGGAAENQQALTMLLAAAREAGFAEVAFLFEPTAAAFEYEARLGEDQLVLVVDIGGGTTDCSFLRAGPDRRNQRARDADVLGHCGERLGGNDYDQQLALKAVMPEFGLEDELKSGLPLPNTYFVDAVSANDVNAQQRFYSRRSAERINEFVRDAKRPERVRRLRALQEGRGSYQLLREVEATKIELSSEPQCCVDLGFLEPGLELVCSRDRLRRSSERLLTHLADLIAESRRQAGVEPDVVYLTGGMARSAIVREHLEQICRGIPLIDSDHFASVTKGLTIWASRIFKPVS